MSLSQEEIAQGAQIMLRAANQIERLVFALGKAHAAIEVLSNEDVTKEQKLVAVREYRDALLATKGM